MKAANQISRTTVVEDLGFEPVGLEEFKEYAQITFNDDDNVIEAILFTARQQLENTTGKSFGEKRIEVEFSHNGYSAIILPKGPIAEICELKYTTCACKDYSCDLLSTDWSLKGDRFQGPNGFYKVIYKAGYEELPEQVKTAIKAQALYLYENKGDSGRSGFSGIALTLIQPFAKMC